MLTISFHDDKPLYEQLYNHIRTEIESGKIGAGEKLPSKRTLSAHLKISVVTVETAYALLAAEGYIYSVPDSGYYAERLPGTFQRKENSIPLPSKPAEREYRFDFRTNQVDTELFPFSVWARLSREILSSGGDELLQSCNGKGVYTLRQAIAGHLRSFRGIEVYPEQIVVGAGGEYLTGLLVQLLGRDKVYGVEEPGYVKTRRVFAANCRKVVPIQLDESGARPESLLEQGVQVAHLTPSHHFPLGTVMPAARRHEVLSCPGPAPGRTDTLLRTIMTAIFDFPASRFLRCKVWTAAAGWFTSTPLPRVLRLPCASDTWCFLRDCWSVLMRDWAFTPVQCRSLNS